MELTQGALFLALVFEVAAEENHPHAGAEENQPDNAEDRKLFGVLAVGQ